MRVDCFAAIPLITIMVSYCVQSYAVYRSKNRTRSHGFNYTYYAVTSAPGLDHGYMFKIRKISGQYRCYIMKKPSYRGRELSRYMPHILVDKNNAPYICWTGKIEYVAQAKNLCRKWSDATQQFIDTGVPAPGFGR